MSYSRLLKELFTFAKALVNKVGKDGFEPPNSEEDRFTVCCRWPLGYLPRLNPDSRSGSIMPPASIELATFPVHTGMLCHASFNRPGFSEPPARIELATY